MRPPRGDAVALLTEAEPRSAPAPIPTGSMEPSRTEKVETLLREHNSFDWYKWLVRWDHKSLDKTFVSEFWAKVHFVANGGGPLVHTAVDWVRALSTCVDKAPLKERVQLLMDHLEAASADNGGHEADSPGVGSADPSPPGSPKNRSAASFTPN